METSSDDESPQYKLNKEPYPFRVQNNGQSKTRRSSLASFAIVQDELAGLSEQRGSLRSKTSRDRFVADSVEHTIPLCATPRSRRLAKAIGEAGDRRLCFHSPENVNPTDPPRNVVPFRKELQRLTRELYEVPAPPSATSASTNLCRQPETCLGAPGLDDDFYSRLAAWSGSDLLAVAMHSSVVFRNMRTQTIGRVVSIGREESVTCIGWTSDSTSLAVGNDWGYVRIYEPNTHLLVHELIPHHEKDLVGDFCWKDANVLTVGYQSGQMRQFDIREPSGGKVIGSHKARVCGVEWNPEGRLLATGGGDGLVICWDARAGTSGPLATFGHDLPFSSPDLSSSPGPESNTSSATNLSTDITGLTRRWRARKHLSTVKALAWCPWSPELLASGGGTKDGAIHFWDAVRGRQKKLAINTHSQVTSLHFAPSCREIVSTHGYAFAAVHPDSSGVLPAPRRHSVLVHSYPRGEMTGKVFDAPHGRITHSCLSPDGTRLVTCGSDDSIRIYKVFGKQEIDFRDENMWSQNIIR